MQTNCPQSVHAVNSTKQAFTVLYCFFGPQFLVFWTSDCKAEATYSNIKDLKHYRADTDEQDGLLYIEDIGFLWPFYAVVSGFLSNSKCGKKINI